MQHMKRMRYISGSIFKALPVLLALVLSGSLSAQDTLRTYGPRFGLDLARLIYLFTDPSETGAEASVDFEVYRNVYPVFELGFNSMSDSRELFDYSSSGAYGRGGVDYNVLSLKDRSAHHGITLGFRYGMSRFTQKVEDILIPEVYWGDFQAEDYENSLTGYWIELVGGMKAEVVSNFFLGWSLRYKILLNPDMDPVMVPEMIPGYGTGGEDRVFGFTYSIYYKIPLFKK